MTNATTSSAQVPTSNGRKYVQQLCKHWAHNLHVELSGDIGRVTFPANARGAEWPGDALITLTPSDTDIACRIDASAPGQLEGLKGALARHLDRFAFREAPLPFAWVDEVPSQTG